MDPLSLERLHALPAEMFTIIKSARTHMGPRLGRLQLPDRTTLDTPSYLAITSRGVVPHLTPDAFARDTKINGVYMGLEDCTCSQAFRPEHHIYP